MDKDEILNQYFNNTLVDNFNSIKDLEQLRDYILTVLHSVMDEVREEDDFKKRKVLVDKHYDLMQAKKQVQSKMNKIAMAKYRG